ncbi:hypothetical protein SAMN05444266_105242 [Chitinophaga jiangningensis]|uniref:Uncharacterized protein n=1 Tax=Chitinophaga jiangningensis TaxID=1419482 RepID=A0A1M7E2Z8_9BACT|nr:hypothetical protein SAMN05444266_105242 [Chitinophaga jiangningensis]
MDISGTYRPVIFDNIYADDDLVRICEEKSANFNEVLTGRNLVFFASRLKN